MPSSNAVATDRTSSRAGRFIARRVLLAVALVAFGLMAITGGTAALQVNPAAAQSTGSTVPSTTQPPDFIPADSSPSIIPNPNSGVEPTADGDRGSARQYVVFGIMIGGMCAIVLLVRRESRKKRRIT